MKEVFQIGSVVVLFMAVVAGVIFVGVRGDVSLTNSRRAACVQEAQALKAKNHIFLGGNADKNYCIVETQSGQLQELKEAE